jgi:hypothetical protein
VGNEEMTALGFLQLGFHAAKVNKDRSSETMMAGEG